MNKSFTESSLIEQPAIKIFQSLGYTHQDCFYKTCEEHGAMYKTLLKILSGFILLFTLSCASVPMPGSSAFSFGASSKLTEGHNLFVKKEYEKAIVILNDVISDAINKGNFVEAAHAHGQLGMLYAEMVYYSDAEKHHIEAVNLSEKANYDPSIFYAQWAITRARMWDYDNGMKYANKALDLLSKRWEKNGDKNRDAVIDDVVAHLGFPPRC